MVGIIGAGISGLATAWYLQKLGVEVVLLEASDRCGGMINTQQADGFIMEWGPNSLLVESEVMGILEELGLTDEIVEANDVNKNRFIFKGGGYQKLPASPPGLLFSSFFSWGTKLAVLRELSRKPQAVSETETVAQFFKRHFNDEIIDYAVAPFVAGIYAGDPDQLILGKTFPMLQDIEAKYGSVVKGMAKENKGKERKKAISFREGMSALPHAMAKGLDIRYAHRPDTITRQNDGVLVQCGEQTFNCKAIVLAAPAKATAALLQSDFPEFAQALSNVTYAPMAGVYSAFQKKDVAHPLDGFGGLNPKAENRFSSGSIWSSSVFEGKAPEGQVLFTSFVGGMQSPEKASLSEEQLKAGVLDELKSSFGISGEPTHQWVTQWEEAIPQYDANILPIAAWTEKLEQQRIFTCVNWYGGVSIPDRLKQGKEVAERIMGSLG